MAQNRQHSCLIHVYQGFGGSVKHIIVNASVLFFAFFSISAAAAKAPVECADLIKELSDHWNVTAKGLARIGKEFKESDSAIDAIATALVAHGFAYLDGSPGGGKSAVARRMLDAELSTINGDTGTQSVFAQQFHKLLTETVINGFPKINEFLKTGEYNFDTTDALAGDRFALFLIDEIHNALPSTSSSMLSLTAERKALLGRLTKDAAFRAGLFASNKTVPAFLESYGSDRPTAEAVLDRMHIKHTMQNKIVSDDEFLDLLKNARSKYQARLALTALKPLIDQVKVPKDLLPSISHVIFETDRANQLAISEAELEYKQMLRDEVGESPANRFTYRSDKQLVADTMRAAFLVSQIRDGVTPDKIRLTMEPRDIIHLAAGAIYGGPGKIRLQRFKGELEIDPPLPDAEKTANPDYKPRTISFEYEPGTSTVYLENPVLGSGHITRVHANHSKKMLEGEYGEDGFIEHLAFNDAQITRLFDHLTNLEQKHLNKGSTRETPQFEDDGFLAKYLALPHLSGEERAQMENIQNKRSQFVNLVNALMRDPQKPAPSKKPAARPVLDVQTRTAMEREVADPKTSPQRSLELRWNLTANAMAQLGNQLTNLDYAAAPVGSAFLGRQNFLLMGPPGGAKSLLATLMMNSEKAGANILERTDKERNFVYQFNRMSPAQKISGGEVTEKLLDGRRTVNPKGSMADPDNYFVLGDEVHNANPATFQAMLSLLNEFERDALHGSEQIPTNLRTIGLTSNKTPAEFLESFGSDRSSGVAGLDRVAHIVLVNNKPDSPEELSDYLSDVLDKKDAGKALPPSFLSTMTDEVLGRPEVRGEDGEILEKGTPGLIEMKTSLALIARSALRKYLAMRLPVSQKKRDMHAMDARQTRDLEHVPEGSTRLELMFYKAAKARMVMEQLMRGTQFSEMKRSFDIKDLLAAAAPWRMGVPGEKLEWTTEGNVPQIVVPKEEKQIGTHHDPRMQEVLKIAAEQQADFISAMNAAVREYVVAHRASIEQYPELFPELLLKSKKAK